MQKIKLSLIVARLLHPGMGHNPFLNAQHSMASKIMDKMIKR